MLIFYFFATLYLCLYFRKKNTFICHYHLFFNKIINYMDELMDGQTSSTAFILGFDLLFQC